MVLCLTRLVSCYTTLHQRCTWKGDCVLNRPYLLFDAGGTLVFPNESFLIEEAAKYGITLTHDQLFDGYYRTIYRWDRAAQICPEPPPRDPWPRGYAYTLFETLGMTSPTTNKIAEAFNVKHKEENLWTYTLPEVTAVLTSLLNQGYKMSVLSNSDGRTDEVFHNAGLSGFFQHIFDSKRIGHEKPDSRIFKHVLRKLKLRPEEAIYIGDVFWVDIIGARQAGLKALHIDPLGLYTDKYWSAARVSSIRHLEKWLTDLDPPFSYPHHFLSLSPLLNVSLRVNKHSYARGDDYEYDIEMAALTRS